MIDRAQTSFARQPRRPLRFLIVGVLGFGVQVAALGTLTSVAHWSWLPATVLSVELAIVHNFLWHARWTWAGAETDASDSLSFKLAPVHVDSQIVRFVRFNLATGLVSIIGNVALMALYEGALRVPTILANSLAVASMAALNFVVADQWIFTSSGRVAEASDRHRDSGHTNTRSSAVTAWPSAQHCVARDSCARVVPASRVASKPHGMANRGAGGVRSFRYFRESSACIVFVLLAASCAAPSAAEAAPAAETVAAWNRYVAETEGRIASERTRQSAGRLDHTPGRRVVPRSIECDGESISIANGTISRWRGLVFLPGISLDQLLRRLWDPGTPPPQEDVTAARVLSRTSDSLRVYLRLVRKTIVTVTYDTEHEMRFHRWSPELATARSVATRLDEVGGDDHGFLWRLNSYWTYRATDGGVLVQLDSLTLSRSVPILARPLASPLITRISSESMVRTLEALRRAMASS